MAKIKPSKAITDKTRVNKITLPQIRMGKIPLNKDTKVSSRVATIITNKEIMDKGATGSKGIITKTKDKAETVILVQINRKETPTAMGKVNKINGLDLKEEMTMVLTDNMEESKIMETRFAELLV